MGPVRKFVDELLLSLRVWLATPLELTRLDQHVVDRPDLQVDGVVVRFDANPRQIGFFCQPSSPATTPRAVRCVISCSTELRVASACAVAGGNIDGMLGVELLARVGLATALGLAIGVERQWRSSMAGLQTMALVSMGSALFLVLGAYSFGMEADPTRVAAQIVTGIGFIGAGVIMKQGASVKGLNTAATLWATAAVGALAGAWMWREAITGAVIIVMGNLFLHPLGLRMDRIGSQIGRERTSADYIFEVVCARSAEVRIHGMLIDTLTHAPSQLRSLQSVLMPSGEEVQLQAGLSTVARDDAVLENAVRTFSAEPDVRSARWATPNEAPANWGG